MINIDALPSVFDFHGTEIEWVIPGILPASAITAFTGDSGSGKDDIRHGDCRSRGDGY